jgi:hypothetical protein
MFARKGANMAKTDDSSPADPLFLDLANTPTLFVDGMQGISVVNDVVKINLFQVVQNLNDPDGQLTRVVVGRLAMSPSTLVQSLKWLNENVKIQNLDAPPTPEDGKE